MSQAKSVVVVGGGAIGCATAYYAARAGLRVTLIDNPKRGRASSASAGGTWPLGESLGLGCGIIFYKTLLAQGAVPKGALGPESLPKEFLDFSLASNNLFPALAEDVKTCCGMDMEFEHTTLLFVMYDEGDVAFAKALLEKFPRDRTLIEWLSPAEVKKCEPAVTPGNQGALRFVTDHQVNPYRFADSLRGAAKAEGATIISHTEVTGLKRVGDRVTAVQTALGEFPCDVAINAAGSWAPQVGRMAGLTIPVYPVRGQIVGTEHLPELLKACLSTSDCYLAQKHHGEIIIGSTTEEVGYDVATRPDAIAELARGAIRCLPFLKNVGVKRVWTGLRPGTPDELPILGPADGVSGYLNACGHFRTGILNAPLTAQLLTAILLEQPLSVPIEPFLLSRFPPDAAAKTVPEPGKGLAAAAPAGGIGFSRRRAMAVARQGYMSSFLGWVEDQRQKLADLVSRQQDLDFIAAVGAGCALVAAADGIVRAAEKQAMADTITRTPEARVLDVADLVSRFNRIVEVFEFNHEMGKQEAVKTVARLKERPEAARTLVRLCCTIGAADGHFDPNEMKMVREMCGALALNPAEFRLGLVENVFD